MKRILISAMGASLIAVSLLSLAVPETQLNSIHQLMDICAGVLLIMSTLKRTLP